MGFSRRTLCATLAAASAWLAGCGGPEFGPDPRVPSERRFVLTSGPAPAETLELPSAGPFNIHIKSSSQNPGSTGTARGASDASPQGQAFCAAEAANGGSAEAEFKIGHRVENRSGQVRRLAVEVRCEVRHQVQTSPEPTFETRAKAELHLAVLDPAQRAVVKIAVLQADSDAAVGTGAFSLTRDLAVDLPPGMSYDVVLYGKATSAGADGQEARARLDLEQLRIRLDFVAAGTAPAG